MIDTALEWIKDNPQVLVMAGVTLAMTIACAVLAGVMLVRVPPDYFEKERKPRKKGWAKIALNVAGWVLIAAGLAMMVLPGPGVLVVLIGVMLAEFPGKFRVQRWIISRKKVLRGANALRKRFAKPPLKVSAS